ncbi:MAG TPA: hypothetical protein VJ844_13565, partial [Mucilaginibacter sp.]|nr:hypothetical protein [Mucilaginibacter sp.]
MTNNLCIGVVIRKLKHVGLCIVICLTAAFKIQAQANINTRAENFQPGAIWPDNNGVHINAHGGGMLYHDGTYYWFGEHKVEGKKGNSAQVGIHCYSSKNLYQWNDEGIALKV